MASDASPDPVAAYLAEVRERTSLRQQHEETMARLLAAVEAASKLAGDWTRKADALEATAAQVAAEAPGEPGAPLKLGRARGFGECAHQLAYVLRAALLGEGSG